MLMQLLYNFVKLPISFLICIESFGVPEVAGPPKAAPDDFSPLGSVTTFGTTYDSGQKDRIPVRSLSQQGQAFQMRSAQAIKVRRRADSDRQGFLGISAARPS